jgi:hypothetical protein
LLALHLKWVSSVWLYFRGAGLLMRSFPVSILHVTPTKAILLSRFAGLFASIKMQACRQ